MQKRLKLERLEKREWVWGTKTETPAQKKSFSWSGHNTVYFQPKTHLFFLFMQFKFYILWALILLRRFRVWIESPIGIVISLDKSSRYVLVSRNRIEYYACWLCISIYIYILITYNMNLYILWKRFCNWKSENNIELAIMDCLMVVWSYIVIVWYLLGTHSVNHMCSIPL